MKTSSGITGKFTVRKFKRGASEPYEVLEAQNAVQAAGIELLLDLGIGAVGDIEQMDFETDLLIFNSVPVLETTLGTTDLSYPQNFGDPGISEGDVVWLWEDSSTDAYTPDSLEVESPEGTTFSIASVNFGSKPSDETWQYEYTLTLGSSEPALIDEGLDQWLQLLTGANEEPWDDTNTEARLYNASSVLQATAQCSAGPTRGTGAESQQVTWEFEFASGEGDGDWAVFDMEVVGTFTAGDLVLRSGSTGTTGTKGSGDIWTFVYTFEINDN